MTGVLTLALLVLGGVPAPVGQSDSWERRILLEAQDRVPAKFLSGETMGETPRSFLLSNTRRYAATGTASSGQPGSIEALQVTVQRLERAVSELAAAVADERERRLEAEALIYSEGYRVTGGDTLGAIAAQHGISVRAIQLVNAMGNSTMIRAGQNLQVPSTSTLRALEAGLQSMQSAIPALEGQLSSSREELQEAQGALADQIQATGIDFGAEVGRLEGELEGAGATLWVLLGGLIAGVCAGGYGFRRLQRHSVGHTAELTAQRNELTARREEGIRLDTKLLELLEKQMELAETGREASTPSDDDDHSLALRVADELVRLEKNFSRMSEDTKGLKQLKASVRRIKDTLEVKGYELVDLLGQRHDPGMKAIVTVREDDTLVEGEAVITRIIKPQVNYRGQMVQTAQVEVSQGTKGVV